MTDNIHDIHNIPTSLIEDVKAEFLLNLLHGDDLASWQIEHKGAFYRNYSPDIMEMDEENRYLTLSRDGFMQLLPNELLSPPDELRGRAPLEAYQKVQRRLRLLRDAFLPLDVLKMERLLDIEKEAARMLENERRDLISRFWGIDIEAQADPYVKALLPLLPYVSVMRGDLPFVRTLIETLTGHPTTMTTGRYDVGENKNEAWPMVTYIVTIEGLDGPQYDEADRRLDPLRQFLAEWLMPYDTVFGLVIRDARGRDKLNDNVVLGYNTAI